MYDPTIPTCMNKRIITVDERSKITKIIES